MNPKSRTFTVTLCGQPTDVEAIVTTCRDERGKYREVEVLTIGNLPDSCFTDACVNQAREAILNILEG